MVTQPENPRVVTYRRMIAAFNSNDLSLVSQFVSADLRYTIPGRSPIAGTTLGVNEHLRMLKLARDLTSGTLKLAPLATAVDGDYLFVWGRLNATRDNKYLDCEHGVMYRFAGDRVVEGRTLPTNQYQFDDFFS